MRMQDNDLTLALSNKLTSNGPNILLLGYGQEGRSSHRFLESIEAPVNIRIYDRSPIPDLIESPNLGTCAGELTSDVFDKIDLVLKSPGIPLPENIWAQYGDKITSQSEIFLECNRNKVIGITGTKGKSTTASLIASILQLDGLTTILCGNIGIPCFDMLEESQSARWENNPLI